MSQEAKQPEEIGRRVFEAVARRDLDAAVDGLHEDAVIDLSRSRSPYRGVYRGREGARQAWAEFLEAWEAITWEFEVIGRPASDTVVVESRPRARGRGSGIEMKGMGAWLWQVRDGKLSRGVLFQSPEEALAAARGEPDDADSTNF